MKNKSSNRNKFVVSQTFCKSCIVQTEYMNPRKLIDFKLQCKFFLVKSRKMERTSIDLNTKERIIQQIASGPREIDVAKEFNVASTNLSDILKRNSIILER